MNRPAGLKTIDRMVLLASVASLLWALWDSSQGRPIPSTDSSAVEAYREITRRIETARIPAGSVNEDVAQIPRRLEAEGLRVVEARAEGEGLRVVVEGAPGRILAALGSNARTIRLTESRAEVLFYPIIKIAPPASPEEAERILASFSHVEDRVSLPDSSLLARAFGSSIPSSDRKSVV